MNLTLDCDLNAAWLSNPASPALAQLLAKGQIRHQALPLEALVCQQFGLSATPDYPLAAIAAQADGLAADTGYWLRADPAHLVLQRDCLSLHESWPLAVSAEHAKVLLASLNQHFSAEGLCFMRGHSGAWYVHTAQSPQIKTSLPSAALARNVHEFLAQGVDASRWLALLNEVQMLLHEHPVNVAREAAGELALNSVWFSGGGCLPSRPALAHELSSLMADKVFYQGWAQLSGLPFSALVANFTALLLESPRHLRVHLPCNDTLDSDWFAPLLLALQRQKISQLQLNLGFYEQTLSLTVRPRDLYKFWCRSRPLMGYWA